MFGRWSSVTTEPLRTAGRGLGPSAVALGLALLLPLAPAVAKQASRATLLRGKTDQNQPLLLRVDRRRHVMRFRIGLLVTHCRGKGRDVSDFGVPHASVVRGPRWIPLGSAGHARTSYAIRRHLLREDGFDNVRLRSRVVFRATIGRHGSASGTL